MVRRTLLTFLVPVALLEMFSPAISAQQQPLGEVTQIKGVFTADAAQWLLGPGKLQTMSATKHRRDGTSYSKIPQRNQGGRYGRSKIHQRIYAPQQG